MTTDAAPGFEAEPQFVAAEVANCLDGITDPWERYVRATAGQAHHDAVAAALQKERDKALAALNTGTKDERLSYEALADRTALTRSGVQKAVERGRRELG
ncbi:hypothetical protein ABT282_38455 [Streptomyces sp. NPDC000927]|uniref:hypothetical protein n=1 Tax=Streptomyces sp. NPDC000927 TaxID=3154371 RepID=UPI0033292918